ncbi:MAG: polysaccharide biosynthesis/export family protein [Pseudomonadota bacterium]
MFAVHRRSGLFALRAGALSSQVLLAACSGLPGSGPSTGAVLRNSEISTEAAQTEPYVLVSMTSKLAEAISVGAAEAAFEGSLEDFTDPSPPLLIGAGDELEVTIVQVTNINVGTQGVTDIANALVSPLSQTTIPAQRVLPNGRVTVPPAGTFRVLGMSPQQLESLLTRQLALSVVDPTVLVRVTDRESAKVRIIGEVEAPGAIALLRQNMRLIDALSEAGGPTGAIEELELTLIRDGRTLRMPLKAVLEDEAASMLPIHPGDVIHVKDSGNFFAVRGAVGVPGRYKLTEQFYTLSDALAEARGVGNRRGSRKGVFVYRRVPQSTLTANGIDATSLGMDPVPVIFQFDYRRPTTIFASQQFVITDGDVIFVSDNIIEEINKIFGLLTGVVQPNNFVPTVPIGGN